ncbi:MAG TPA: GFA family protein [Burkholderiales bacterium]|nr:GFA family protein [Burkholderiales bacterium]
MTEIHTGGCLCGAVRYRVTSKPNFVAVCHCKFCQKRLASAFSIVAAFDEKSVEFTQGKLAEYEHRSDESGRWLKMNFCPTCGTTVSHTAEARPGMRSIAAGTFDDTDWLNIDRHIWLKSKMPWVGVPEGMVTFERGATPAPQASTKS